MCQKNSSRNGKFKNGKWKIENGKLKIENGK